MKHCCGAARRVINKSIIFPQHGSRADCKVLDKSNLFWQHSAEQLPSFKQIKFISTTRLQSRLSSMYQHTSMPHWNHGKRKYWHSFNSLPIGRLFWFLAKRDVKERRSFKTTSSITTAIDVWLPLTMLLVQGTLPISYQSTHWSANTYVCSITLVLGQRLLLMTC